MRLLVVEDDAQLRAVIALTFQDLGYAVDTAAEGAAADRLLGNRDFDVVVLDLGLPLVDGLEILRRVRRRRSETAVLVITARHRVEERIRGLDLGADDYLVKPFALGELEARVRALLRRQTKAGAVLESGRVRLDTRERVVYADDTLVALAPREFAILEMLLLHQGRVVSKAKLVGQQSGEAKIASAAIDVFVHRLRRKFEPAGLSIKTIRGVGYIVPNEAGI
ncbi:MAG TPA: response regulator transcription factor [Casimicrobiaceae bacterium]|nr:response regulator transcription factor [Casimicrobiaceae bacterium]